MRRAIVLALSAALTGASPASAQVLRAVLPIGASPSVRIAPVSLTTVGSPALSPSAPVSLTPGLSLSETGLLSPKLDVRLPAALPAVQAPRTTARTAAVGVPVSRPVTAPRAVLRRLAGETSAKALGPSRSPQRRVRALGRAFDGAGAGRKKDSAVPLASAGGAVAAATLQNPYGFYSWLSGLPEIEALESEEGARPELAKARLLLAAEPLLSKGAVIAMKEGESVTVLAAADPSVAPAVLSVSHDDLTAPAASTGETLLAEELERAAARDRAEGNFTNKVQVLNRLRRFVGAEAPAKKPAGSLLTGGEMPLDPVRRPWEYLQRFLRDAMRSEDPYEALDMLSRAKSEARRYLNYQDASKFLESLHSQGGLMASRFLPGLLKSLQKAAGDDDKAAVERIAKAAYGYAEYAPKWEKRVKEAHRQARETLKLLKDFGPIDRETGRPAEKPAEFPSYGPVSDRYRAPAGLGRIDLSESDPDEHEGFRIESKSEARKALRKDQEKLRELQRKLYEAAEYGGEKRKPLIVLQAMDTGGKDGAIRWVAGPLNPQGVRVANFKKPTEEEAKRHFLRRAAEALRKALGMITIFNRSHYEDILVPTVWETLPAEVIESRYDEIVEFEKDLVKQGFIVMKFFLNISKDEQKERLEERLKEKPWKYEPSDIEARRRWGRFQETYGRIIARTNKPWAPWYIVPANRKWYRNFVVGRILLETLESLDLRYPAPKHDVSKVVIPD